MYKCFFKRCFDFWISLFAIIALIPVFIIIAIAIKASSKGPILFVQKRVGKNLKEFNIYKFRTMIIEAPKNCPTSELKSSHSYITRVGKLLRKTSLDELPQIINILKGEMSFVGPRPIIPHEKTLHDYRTRYGVYSILPGLTGLAQIRGRDEISTDTKVRYDAEYAQDITFINDIKIMWYTFFKVTRCEGVQEGENTMLRSSSKHGVDFNSVSSSYINNQE